MKRTLAAFAAVSCLLGPGQVQAQPLIVDDRVEFFGGVGFARFGPGQTVWADGIEVVGGITLLPFRGPLRKLGIQASASVLNQDSERLGTATQTVDASQFLATATWHFSRARVQPYVLGGLAVLRAERTWRCETCSYGVEPGTGRLLAQELNEHVDATELGLAFGGGLRVLTGRRLVARVEGTIADTTPGAGWNWGWSALRAGLGVRF